MDSQMIMEEINASDEETDSGNKTRISLPPVPQNQSVVLLAHLIDAATQRIFSELTILSELLPRKSDTERKISIDRFAHSTRQLFVRLLAVVKWAKNSDKVDMCDRICYFLSQQSLLFCDTADRLFDISRFKLVGARLPTFQVPAAIDVLTLGTYPRLPASIKSKFIPESAITSKEQCCILKRLGQGIQHRIMSSAYPLPTYMRNVTVQKGMAIFLVDGEFMACLTLLGELHNTPWTLLNLKFLVNDPTNSVSHGAQLVHPLQVFYVHQVVQGRLNTADQPLQELYTVLHNFCVSLQLEVLMCQANRLMQTRRGGGHNMRVLEYTQGSRLVIAYWLRSTSDAPPVGVSHGFSQGSGGSDPGADFSYKLIIQTNPEDVQAPLIASHTPAADFTLPAVHAYADGLDVESILTTTILCRIQQRLRRLRSRLKDLGISVSLNKTRSPTASGSRDIITKAVSSRRKRSHDVHSTTSYPTLECCLVEAPSSNEVLTITIHAFSGRFICELELLGESNSRLVGALQKSLDQSDWPAMKNILIELRYLTIIDRCRKAVTQLPVNVYTELALAPDSVLLKNLNRAHNKIFLKFLRFGNFYLIVCLENCSDFSSEIKLHYSIMISKLVDARSNVPVQGAGHKDDMGRGVLIKPTNIVELDYNSLNMKHFSRRSDSAIFPEPIFQLGSKRPHHNDDHSTLSADEPVPKKLKLLSASNTRFSFTDLCHVVALCQQRIPFLVLSEQLKKLGIQFQPIRIESKSNTYVLRIIGISSVPGCPKDVFDIFWANVLSCSIRISQSTQVLCSIELVLTESPLPSFGSNYDKERKVITHRYSVESLGATLEEFLNQLCYFAHMYVPMKEFAPVFRNKMHRYIMIRHNSWQKLWLGYGPNYAYTVMIEWRAHSQQNMPRSAGGEQASPVPTSRYHLTFGGHGVSIMNPHAVIAPALIARFNRPDDLKISKSNGGVPSIAGLAHLLSETICPLLSISTLSNRPFLMGHDQSAAQSDPRAQPQAAQTDHRAQQYFVVLHIHTDVYRLVFRETFCLEIRCLASGQVALSDVGSVIQSSKLAGSSPNASSRIFMPFYGFKAFIAKYMNDPSGIGTTSRNQSSDTCGAGESDTSRPDRQTSGAGGLKPSHSSTTVFAGGPTSVESLRQPSSVSGAGYQPSGGPSSVGGPTSVGQYHSVGGAGSGSVAGMHGSPFPHQHSFNQPHSHGGPMSMGGVSSQPATPASPMKMNPGSIQAPSPANYPPLSSPSSNLINPSPLVGGGGHSTSGGGALVAPSPSQHPGGPQSCYGGTMAQSPHPSSMHGVPASPAQPHSVPVATSREHHHSSSYGGGGPGGHQGGPMSVGGGGFTTPQPSPVQPRPHPSPAAGGGSSQQHGMHGGMGSTSDLQHPGMDFNTSVGSWHDGISTTMGGAASSSNPPSVVSAPMSVGGTFPSSVGPPASTGQAPDQHGNTAHGGVTGGGSSETNDPNNASSSQMIDWTPAGAGPLVLSHDAFDSLMATRGCSSAPIYPTTSTNSQQSSQQQSRYFLSALDKHLPGPFERYCGCLYLMSKIERGLRNFSVNVTKTKSAPMTLNFNASGFQCSIFVDETTLCDVRLSVSVADSNESWSPDELTTLERYFTNVVVGNGFRETRCFSFLQLLILGKSQKLDLLRNFLSIMRTEMGPRQPDVVWDVSLLWAVPPTYLMAIRMPAMPNFRPGSVSVTRCAQKAKILFWVKFVNVKQPTVQLCFPFIYEIIPPNNKLMIWSDPYNPAALPPEVRHVNNVVMKNSQMFAASNDLSGPDGKQCFIWRAIQEIMRTMPGGH